MTAVVIQLTTPVLSALSRTQIPIHGGRSISVDQQQSTELISLTETDRVYLVRDCDQLCYIMFSRGCSCVSFRNFCKQLLIIALIYVNVWNTADRTKNFVVGLTDVQPNISTPTLWNYTLCGQYPGAVPAAKTVSLYCPNNLPPFRYVVVQFPITAQVNLCELEVIAPGTWLSLPMLHETRLPAVSSYWSSNKQTCRRSLLFGRYS